MPVSHATVIADAVVRGVPKDLDAAGYRRFSGARMSQGRTRFLYEESSSGLIQMGDWRVSHTRCRESENEGAYHVAPSRARGQ